MVTYYEWKDDDHEQIRWIQKQDLGGKMLVRYGLNTSL